MMVHVGKIDQHALMKQVLLLNKQLALLRANQVSNLCWEKPKTGPKMAAAGPAKRAFPQHYF